MVGNGKAIEPDHDLRNVGTVVIAPDERRMRLTMYAQDTSRDAIHEAGSRRGTPILLASTGPACTSAPPRFPLFCAPDTDPSGRYDAVRAAAPTNTYRGHEALTSGV
jgi:hypothetical protein